MTKEMLFNHLEMRESNFFNVTRLVSGCVVQPGFVTSELSS